MAFFCFTYDMEYRNLVQEYELNVGEDLSRKAEFILTSRPRYVRNDRRDDHEKCEVLGSHDMKNIAVILVDNMNPGAHGHVF